MKSNKIITVLIVVAVVLAIVLAGLVGIYWYRETHIFIEGAAYPKKAQSLDLLEKDISVQHYDALHSSLPECDVLWNVPLHGEKIASNSTSITVSDLSEEDISVISKYFPLLETVDASACSDYSALEKLQSRLSNVKVVYGVFMGKESVPADSEDLELKVEDYAYDTLLENLSHMPSLKTVKMEAGEISLDQINSLKETYPDITFLCTVTMNNAEYDLELTELDMSDFSAAEVDAIADKLGMLLSLKSVQLAHRDGSSEFSMEDAAKLMKAAPGVDFNYNFEFYDQKLNSSTTEEVIVRNTHIGDENEAAIRLALDLLPNCKRFVLDNCGVSSEMMSELREEYRGRTKVVWRITFGEASTLTDVEVLRSTYNVKDDNSQELVYLEDVRYIDFGHNEFLDSISFIENMPKLEVVIVSGAPFKTLEPFKVCKNLRVLEMANCLYAPDLEPLRELENLQLLNIGFSSVSDLSPIEDLKLTNLTMTHSKVSDADRKAYQESHPDCWVVTSGDQPYGKGWRYDDDMNFLPWYEEIKEVFHYPKSPNNIGWYLGKDPGAY